MKKVYCLFIALLFLNCSAFAFSFGKGKNGIKKQKVKQTETMPSWQNINDNIYMDTNSIKKDKKTASSVFKIYTPHDFGYKTEKYKANCKKNTLELKESKLYDKDNNLLKETKSNGLKSDYKGVVNGETYFRALCN